MCFFFYGELYLSTLLNLFVIGAESECACVSVCMRSLGISTYKFMSPSHRDNFTFPSCYACLCISFSCLIALTRNSHSMFLEVAKIDILLLFVILQKNIFRLYWVWCHLWVFHGLYCIKICFPTLLSTFVMKGCWKFFFCYNYNDHVFIFPFVF